MFTADTRPLTGAHRSCIIVLFGLLGTGTRVCAQIAPMAQDPGADEITCSMLTPSGSHPCAEPAARGACGAEADFGSRPSDESTAIVFNNRSDQAVKIWWLNFHGQRVLYNPNLAPNVRDAQQTFVGHNWMVTTGSGQCLAIYTADAPPLTAAGATPAVAAMPPAIPGEEQAPPPGDNLIWTPGYWAWNAGVGEYYWVPGEWVGAPIVGYLWTPGYWALEHGRYDWHAGYWGPHVGFYGGINYGHGYFGRGFTGGTWRDGQMYYNRAVTQVGSRSAYVYGAPSAVASGASRMSFHGVGGSRLQPSAEELVAAADYHLPATPVQLAQVRAAQSNPAMSAASNNGHPPSGASRPDGSGSPTHLAGTMSVTHFDAPPSAVPAASADRTATRASAARSNAPRPAPGTLERSSAFTEAASGPMEPNPRPKAPRPVRTRPVARAESR